MKKHKKKIIRGIILLIIIIAGIIVYSYLKDENRLTLAERTWINNESGTIHNVNVVNGFNVFSREGSGVFFDFLDDLSAYHNLKFNAVSYNYGESKSGITFKVANDFTENDLLLFDDHFVLVGKNVETLKSIAEFSGRKIGVDNIDLSYLSNSLSDVSNINFVQYDSKDLLLFALEEGTDIDYILVPRNEYIQEILAKDYYITYHLGDVPIYYSLQLSPEEPELSNIMKKFFNIWVEDEFAVSYNKHNLELFISSLGIVEKDQDTLTNKVYSYGFVENSPYEVIMSGTYGGIISSYLKAFSNFSQVELKFIRYKKSNNLYSAINKKNVDLYFNTTDVRDDFHTIPSLLNINYSVITNINNHLTINSLKSLENETVYVLEGSLLASYLKTINYLDIETYKNVKSIPKIKDDNAIIIIDSNIFNYYNRNILKNYVEKYSEVLNQTYNFKTNVNDTFNTLFSKYINSLDPEEMINVGLYNHYITVRRGTIISNIAIYSLSIIAVFLVGGIIYLKRSKKITLKARIKKDDKMRFIDQLTSLKNRNYLSENIEKWNNNNIYPQATIVMDLNSIQEINDTLGYDQGDAQIKAAANILIKTQLENTDIIRTDGNEFLIYLVGYAEKQVVSYIRKIYKELKNLPFDYGAAVGFSMIDDDLKMVEDAINEAVEDMRIKKSENIGE